MSILSAIGKGGLALALLAILFTVLALLSIAVGGVMGYGIYLVYTWFGFSVGFSATEAAMIGSIVGICASSGAAANTGE